MSSEIITIIVSAVAGPVGAWIGSKLQAAKYKTEIEGLRAEVQGKLAGVKNSELDNVRKANEILVDSVVTPLKKELSSLRRDVDKFRKAIEKIPACPHSDHCPVANQLQKYENDDRDNAEDKDSGK